MPPDRGRGHRWAAVPVGCRRRSLRPAPLSQVRSRPFGDGAALWDLAAHRCGTLQHLIRRFSTDVRPGSSGRMGDDGGAQSVIVGADRCYRPAGVARSGVRERPSSPSRRPRHTIALRVMALSLGRARVGSAGGSVPSRSPLKAGPAVGAGMPRTQAPGRIPYPPTPARSDSDDQDKAAGHNHGGTAVNELALVRVVALRHAVTA
jgi:hypothetical protein